MGDIVMECSTDLGLFTLFVYNSMPKCYYRKG